MTHWNRWGLAAGLAAAMALAGQAHAQGTGATSGTSGSGQAGDRSSGRNSETSGTLGGGSGSAGSVQNDTATGPTSTGGEARGSATGSTGSGGTGTGTGASGSATATGSDASGATAQGAAKVSTTLEEGLQKLHAANLAEVQMGELGVQHAENEQVKQFAQRMIDDHRKADEQLTQTTQQMGVDLSGSAFQKEQTKAQKRMDKLTSKTGAAFDKAFMADMVEDHRKDTREVGKLAKQARKGQHQELASFLEQTHTTLQGHLKEAQQTQKALGAQRQARKPGQSSSTGATGSGATDSGAAGSGTGSGTGSGPGSSTGTGGGAGSGSGAGGSEGAGSGGAGGGGAGTGGGSGGGSSSGGGSGGGGTR